VTGAREAFARARATLEGSGQRPLRAIVDYDEGQALARPEVGEVGRAIPLLEVAREAFRSLGMDGWARRAQAALEALAVDAERAIYPVGLSEREAEVLRLIARGHADRQIADELFISPRTVNAHVRNLLTKTERANRTELSIWAVEHGLVGER
jgi:DNA-binding CsgD family transcriptional regulator